MIQANHISKKYGAGEAATRALKDVSLHITKGEMVSIMGPSGCGKSTLLHILSGIEHADEGSVTINGKLLHEMKDKQLSMFRLSQMGFVFQSYHLIPVLTALENVSIPLIAQGMSAKQATAQAKEALRQVGLEDKGDANPTQLSGGQNQRVAIARAIVASPKVIWADEPTGALDSHTADQVIGLLSSLNERFQTTIVIVTHDSNVAARTQRTIRMENGRIVGEGQSGGLHA